MKKTCLMIMLLAGNILGAEVKTSTVSLPIQLLPRTYTAFRPGEKFQFDIKYEFIHGGNATLEVTRGLLVHGRPTIGFISSAQSNKLVDKFFRVRDYNASQADETSLMTVNFHQNLHEGGYKVVRNTTIDYETGKYIFEKFRKGNLSRREGQVTQPACDILSAFYYTRTLPLELGKEYSFSVFSDEDVYQMKVVVGPRLEKIKVEAGEFECFRVQPFVVGDGIFRASEGKMIIWLTNDERKIPVLIRSKVAVGAFDAELTQFQSPLK